MSLHRFFPLLHTVAIVNVKLIDVVTVFPLVCVLHSTDERELHLSALLCFRFKGVEGRSVSSISGLFVWEDGQCVARHKSETYSASKDTYVNWRIHFDYNSLTSSFRVSNDRLERLDFKLCEETLHFNWGGDDVECVSRLGRVSLVLGKASMVGSMYSADEFRPTSKSAPILLVDSHRAFLYRNHPLPSTTPCI
ncbi:hypothetical protein SCHPADRAFT_896862 [Schizopora paradoxa]|uniref:Uncharacterized protein n=1 Tax=Schizopora paradoxa TaxID=27342 RepID=A0A0H2R5A0_9AGAM|nr:hypothetical protein SCHPADRAFT_896862 [Schizopora paradoxa]